MAKKRIGELPSGSIRKKVYSHSEPCFDKHGKPIIDEKTGKPKVKKIYISITGSSAAEVNRKISEYKLNKNTQKKPDDMTLQTCLTDILLPFFAGVAVIKLFVGCCLCFGA